MTPPSAMSAVMIVHFDDVGEIEPAMAQHGADVLHHLTRLAGDSASAS